MKINTIYLSVSTSVQSWELPVFLNFFNNKWFYCILKKLLIYFCTSLI